MWTTTSSNIRSRVSDNLVKSAINKFLKINFNTIFPSAPLCNNCFLSWGYQTNIYIFFSIFLA
jgi:uncharacterized lipoprotein YddW (UPF0748 family)